MPSGSTSPRPEPATARLFVALWPDAAARASLAAWRDRWHWPAGARPVADANLHATLHFIGAFARDRLDALQRTLAAVEPRALTLRPAGTAIWRGGIAVLTLHGDAALFALHADIGAALGGLGVVLDPRPFAPHVTVARRAAHATPPDTLPDLEWQARSFALVESRRGPPSYAVLAAWADRPRA
jgi:2'-5' RNA ligase